MDNSKKNNYIILEYFILISFFSDPYFSISKAMNKGN